MHTYHPNQTIRARRGATGPRVLVVSTLASLAFMLAGFGVAPDAVITFVTPTGQLDVPVKAKPIARAQVDLATSMMVVMVKIKEGDAIKRFEALTTSNIGKVMKLYVGCEVVTSAVITTPIKDGEVQIAGGFGLSEAQSLASKINTGAPRCATLPQP
ncbi:MAG: hypothetical protein AAFR04_12410 [Pseudomonadota bacterium]